MIYFLGFLLGILSASIFNSTASYIILFISLIIIIIKNIKKISVKRVVIFVSLFSIGILSFISYNGYINKKYNNIYLKDKTLYVKVVSDITAKSEDYRTFTGYIDEYKCKAKIEVKTEKDFSYGDIAKLKGTLYPIPDEDTGYSFNNRNYNYSHKIFLKYDCEKVLEVKKDDKEGFVDKLRKLNKKVSKNVKYIFTRNSAILLNGFITGEKSNDEVFDRVMVNTGLSHIVAVSGMHFSILIMLLGTILKRFGIDRRIVSLISIVFSFVFAMFVGLSASVLRALIMIVVLSFADLISVERKSDIRLVLLTAILLIIYNPYIIYDVGFVLSFTSVSGIILFNDRIYNKFIKLPSVLNGIISVSLSSVIITFPFSIFYFGGFSLIFLLANLFITPFVTFYTAYGIIVVIISFISMGLAEIIAIPLEFMLDKTYHFAYFLSEIPHSYVKVREIEKHMILVYYLGIYLFFESKRRIVKHIISGILLFLVIVSLIINLNSYIFKSADIYALGEKDSGKVMISYMDKNCFIDMSTSDGDTYIRRFIESKTGNKLDFLLISSLSNIDMAEELNGLYDRIYYPENILKVKKAKDILDNVSGEKIPLNDENCINLYNLELKFVVDKGYNIKRVTITKDGETIFINKELPFTDSDKNIVSYNVLLYDKNIRYLNNRKKEIRGIKL